MPPQTKADLQLKDTILDRRQDYFSRFLLAAIRSEVLKSSPEMIDFLTISDLKAYEQTVHKYSRFPKHNLQQFVMPEGKLDVSIS